MDRIRSLTAVVAIIWHLATCHLAVRLTNPLQSDTNVSVIVCLLYSFHYIHVMATQGSVTLKRNWGVMVVGEENAVPGTVRPITDHT